MKLTQVWKLQTRLNEFITRPSRKDYDIPPYGASIHDKRENVLRAAFQNINGITTDNFIGAEEVEAMDHLGIDLLGLIETNINWSIDRRLQLSAMIKLKFNDGRFVTSSMKAPSETSYLPGGTAMITRGHNCGRVYRRGADPLGRFTWMALRGRNNTGLLVITGYRVCQNSGTTAGPDTAYMREWEALREEGDTSPDPRKAILDAITELINEWSQLGYHPLVMIDANAELTEKQMLEFTTRHGLIDLVND